MNHSVIRISGDALMSTQPSVSALTATLSWVRGVARTTPSRTPRQLLQPQFHCGNPPPAAEPKTRMRTTGPSDTAHFLSAPQPMERAIGLVGDSILDAFSVVAIEVVHVVDFGVHSDFDEIWSFPCH